MSSVSRLTLFALISSIEEDLRNQIYINLLSQDDTRKIFSEEIYNKCLTRLNTDIEITQEITPFQLLTYLDFGDAFQILNRNKSLLPPEYSKHLSSMTLTLEKLIPIRNRVMHTRPLLFDDLALTFEISRNLVNEKKSFWRYLEETIKKLEKDPSYVLGLVIPPYSLSDETISHNLPIPDFDETGFLGRKNKVDELIRTCLGPYPVITIVGEGGIGKTALALRVAYEIVDKDPKPFDYVVWTSSKTTKITVQEIVRIEGAIKDSIGLIQAVANELGAKGDPIEEILTYLKEFRILLILDNLETVLDDRVRSFLQQLPTGSKVLITSRIGLGALEYPIQLIEMDSSDSIQLLRALATARNVQQLVKTSNETLSKYCSRMKNNPGYIKWFVSAVQSGRRPEEVLSKPDMFLEFCMSNVYGYLSEDSKSILKVMQTVPNELSQPELAFLSGMGDITLQKSLQELLTTNMVNMTSIPVGSTYQSKYDISDLARVYLSKKHPVSSEETKKITKRKNQLLGSTQEIKRAIQENPYSYNSININSQSDLIVAKYLKDALDENRRKNFNNAEFHLRRAKSLAPEYFEVHRVEALINDSQENLAAAKNSYEAAIELEPKSAPLRKWYATFLLRRFDDFDETMNHLLIADKLDPNNFNIQLEILRVKLMLHRFDEVDDMFQKLFNFSNLDALNKRKLFDTKLRYHKDRTENYCSKKDTRNAVKELQLLIKTYIDCPDDIRDRRMKEKLWRATKTARNCREIILANQLDNNDIDVIISWLMKYGSPKQQPSKALDSIVNFKATNQDQLTSGVIDKLCSTFGFIIAGKERLYFHFDDIVNPKNSGALGEGNRVSFIRGENRKGICAKEVYLEG